MLKILNSKHYDDYKQLCGTSSLGIKRREDFEYKLRLVRKKPRIIRLPAESHVVQNHLPFNGLLGNKKAMFYSLREYYRLTKRDIFTVVPLTFHIQNGTRDEEFKRFQNHYNERKRNRRPNIWIIKPGEFTNRGNGISCSSRIEQIKRIVSGCSTSNAAKQEH